MIMSEMSLQLRRRHSLPKLHDSVKSFLRGITRCNHYSFGDFLEKISAGAAMRYIDNLGIKEHEKNDMKILYSIIRIVYYQEIKNKYDAVCGM